MKKYTKKQIQEAIAYWEEQMAKGDYREADEAALREGDGEELRADLERLQAHSSDRDGALEFVEGGGTCVYQYDTDRWNGEPRAITPDRARALLRDSRWKFGDRMWNLHKLKYGIWTGEDGQRRVALFFTETGGSFMC